MVLFTIANVSLPIAKHSSEVVNIELLGPTGRAQALLGEVGWSRHIARVSESDGVIIATGIHRQGIIAGTTTGVDIDRFGVHEVDSCGGSCSGELNFDFTCITGGSGGNSVAVISVERTGQADRVAGIGVACVDVQRGGSIGTASNGDRVIPVVAADIQLRQGV